MVNHRLRAALTAAGLTYEKLAADLRVSPKTVERWVTKARMPYPRHRDELAELLHKSELYFWPQLAGQPGYPDDGIGTNEIVRVYPYRTSMPAMVWSRLLNEAKERINLLLFAGQFLVEQRPNLAEALLAKADGGIRVRLLLGDPACAAVAVRGREEGIGDAVAAEVHDVAGHYRPLAGQPNVEVRFHQTTLYTSIYQFDDEMLVNAHVYGLEGAHAPVFHLRRRAHGPLFETYEMTVERVWQTADPTWPEVPKPRTRSDGVSG